MEETIQPTTITPIKKWDHLPVRPSTFKEFRKLKSQTSDNAFVVELLNVYKIRLNTLAKREEREKEEKN